MSYRDLRCRCCPSLNSFRVGRIIVCISPHPDLSAGAPTPAVSVTTSVFAPQPAEVVTPNSPASSDGLQSSCKICFGLAACDFGRGIVLCDGCAVNLFAISRMDQDPSNIIPIDSSVRFIAKIGDLNANGCRLWKAKCGSSGYGQFLFAGETLNAHRLAWKILVGPIERGLHVLHKCDIPACVNIDHLFLGTNRDNVADMDRKGRRGKPSRAKLSREQVVSMLDRYASGDDISPLAKELGLELRTIASVIHGRCWKSVPRPDGFVIRKRPIGRARDRARYVDIASSDPGVTSSPPDTSRLLDVSEGRDLSFIENPQLLPDLSNHAEMS